MHTGKETMGCVSAAWESHNEASSTVNGCDHSFLVNNAALLIGWINN